MRQRDLIMDWVAQTGSITPAKMAGQLYHGLMFGSETSRRCRDLRGEGKLVSKQVGKFEVFYIPKKQETLL
jgi:hypothetical protein